MPVRLLYTGVVANMPSVERRVHSGGSLKSHPVVFVLLYPLGGSIYDDVDICAVAYAASLGIFAVGVDGVEDRTNQFGGRRLQSGRP